MKPNASRLLGSICAAGALLLLFPPAGHTDDPPSKPSLTIASSGFPAEGMITAKYTCAGANISPPLNWTGAPGGTKSFVLICDDPDAPAGTWVHWVLFNLPATASALPEKVDPIPTLPSGARQGVNDFGKLGYSGPCPPPGKPHHYFFKLYALDARLSLKAGATKTDVLRAMDSHVIAEGFLMGKYQRKK